MRVPDKRFSTNEKASIEIYGRTGRVHASVKNLSTTGACLMIDGPPSILLSKGDLIRITVTLGDLRKKHNLSAEVVWQKGAESGVCFIKPEDVLSKMMDRI